ncbi:MAG: AgmX/PglI C-terminal domain-containing protein, partial [Myxococcota bacterium]|nr:AgmX/PglI C-terminal domain-containing protein [Myxococcota bacterium]
STPRPAAPVRGKGSEVVPARAAPPVEEPAPSPSEPAAAPAPEPAPKKQMTRLPTSVVETMIRNNKRIKRCWMEEKQRSGELPKRVDVKFTVQPSGAVSSARSATKKYRGTDFEVCLGAAFRSITFPPFDGEPLSMTYNFAL